LASTAKVADSAIAAILEEIRGLLIGGKSFTGAGEREFYPFSCGFYLLGRPDLHLPILALA